MRSLCTTLCSHSVLALPDFTKPFHIESYASATAIGGVLIQECRSVHKTIAFLSKMLTSYEKKCNIHEYELLAIVTCYRAWCPHIDGKRTIIIMDHKLSFTSTLNPCSIKVNQIA